jgi:hypothetical protein
MNFKFLALLPVAALFGCGEPTYEECVRRAVKDGGSEYGITLLTDLCDQAQIKRQQLADKRCFADLASEYGWPAVNKYKDALGGGQCELTADLTEEGIDATAADAASSATDPAAGAEAAATEAAALDADAISGAEAAAADVAAATRAAEDAARAAGDAARGAGPDNSDNAY